VNSLLEWVCERPLDAAERIEWLRARNAELVEALERLNNRAESVIYIDVVGNRFRKVFADDLERVRAAIAAAKGGA
jgi:hypothetical protein